MKSVNIKPIKKIDRKSRLMPGGVPRYIRCWDMGPLQLDRYTVVFTGNYRKPAPGVFFYVCMSENPFHPQGFGMHEETMPGSGPLDSGPDVRNRLGKRIKFEDLPESCRNLVVRDYKEIYGIGKN